MDSQATSLGGFGGRLVLNKQKGAVQLNASLAAINPGLELNDLGFAPRTDLINSHVRRRLSLDQADSACTSAPTSTSRFRRVGLRLEQHRPAGLFANGNISSATSGGAGPGQRAARRPLNIRATRGGPAMLNPPGFDWAVGFSSMTGRRWCYGFGLLPQPVPAGCRQQLGYRHPRSSGARCTQLQISVGPSLDRNLDEAQYIGTYADPTATATYGNRYVFGNLDQWTLSGNFRRQLDLHAEAEPRAVHAAVRVDRQLPAVLRNWPRRAPSTSTCSGRTARPTIRPPVSPIPDGPGGPAAPIDIGRPELPVRLAPGQRGAAVGMVTRARRCSWCGRTTGPIRPTR